MQGFLSSVSAERLVVCGCALITHAAALCQQAPEVLWENRRHGGPVLDLAVSPHGDLMASASEDDTIKLWKYSDGSLLETLRAEPKDVTCVDFDPTGALLACGQDRLIHVWRVADAALLNTWTAVFGSGRVNSLAYSPDGLYIATGSGDGSVRLWNAADGTLVRSFLEQLVPALSVAFSPDGQRLATVLDGGDLLLWRVVDGELIARIVPPGRARAVSYSPDGMLIALLCSDQAVRVLNASDLQVRWLLEGHRDNVWCQAFSPDGTWLASGDGDHDEGRLRLWDMENGQQVYEMVVYTERVGAVEFSQDGQKIATVGQYNSGDDIEFWKASDGQYLHPAEVHAGTVTTVAVTTDSGTVFSGAVDAIRIWNAPDGSLARVLTRDLGPAAVAIALAPDNELLAESGKDSEIRLRKVSDGNVVGSLVGHTATVRRVAFSNNGKWIASAANDRKAGLWRVEDRTLIRMLGAGSGFAGPVAFSVDDELLAVGADARLRLHRVSDGTLMHSLQAGSWITTAAFSANGLYLAIGTADGELSVVRTSDWSEMYWFLGPGPVLALAFDSTGATLAAGGEELARPGWMVFWRMADGVELASYRLPFDAVYSLIFTPDGTRFFYGMARYTVAMALHPARLKPGDLNCDGAVTFGDIDPFVLALADERAYRQQYYTCTPRNADCNADGHLDFADIGPFVELLGRQ